MQRIIALVAIVLAVAVSAAAQAGAAADSAWKDYIAGKHAAAVDKLTGLAYGGDADAEYYLGSAYMDGLGIKQSAKMAAWWMEKAARQGHREAQFALGFLYENGAGEGTTAVSADPKAAVYWLEKAADAGQVQAQAALARHYAEGEGVEKDEAKAMRLAEAAARKGDAGSQFNLGVAQARKRDARAWIDAYAWFSLAAEKNYPGARENMSMLAKHLNAQEIDTATKRADAYAGRSGAPRK